MANETIRLADYAASLRYEDLPQEVVQLDQDCITDTFAVIVLGAALHGAGIVTAYSRRIGIGGRSRILGADGPTLHAPAAALANGRLRARVESPQFDEARRRRASRRHVAAAGPGGRTGARQQRARA